MSGYAHPARRSGTFTGAIWLIGIGSVLLVQQTMELPWSQAWPLFLVLVGVASLLTVLFEGRTARSLFTGLAWPTTFVVVGIALFLSTTGRIGTDPGDLIARWWPVAIILLGAWLLLAGLLPGATRATERLEVPLAGAAEASVKITFGGGELLVERGPADMLVAGDFRGGVIQRTPAPGRVELEQETWWRPWASQDAWPHWRVGLTGDVPLDLQVEGGASKTRLDLADLQLRSLALKTGASETRVVLPRAAGSTQVRAESGAAAVIFEVPAGVAARIRSTMGLGSTDVDTTRFPRVSDGWESPDFSSAQNRVEIDARGGVGSVAVRGA